MLIVGLPLLIAIIGLVLYLITVNAKAGELGRIMFAFGLLAFLLAVGSGHVLKIG